MGDSRFAIGSASSASDFTNHPFTNHGFSVMVPAGTMHVAVQDFLDAGFADFDDLDIEVEGFAGERVVAVDDHVVGCWLAQR